MGARMSSASTTNDDNFIPASPTSRRKLEDIPESCIAMVLGYLDPLEICHLARLNKSFCGASSADFIWETKLPTNYLFIVYKLSEFMNNKSDHDRYEDKKNYSNTNNSGDYDKCMGLTKKDLYACLSRPNLFDSGNKEIWLEKSTGGVCVSISSKVLSITGIDDRRYWNYIPTEESRFQTVAYLLQIWWFEVCGELEFKFPPGTYGVFFRLHLGKPSKRFGRRICNTEHIHGWNIRPVQFQLTTSDGQQTKSECYLDNPGSWLLYHGGDFVIKDPDKLTKIKFSARQIDCTHIKGGLALDNVMILPKSFSNKG